MRSMRQIIDTMSTGIKKGFDILIGRLGLRESNYTFAEETGVDIDLQFLDLPDGDKTFQELNRSDCSNSITNTRSLIQFWADKNKKEPNKIVNLNLKAKDQKSDSEKSMTTLEVSSQGLLRQNSETDSEIFENLSHRTSFSSF